jgi:hypothetical protein
MMKRLLVAGADPTYVLSDGRWAGESALTLTETETTNDHVVAELLRRAIRSWKVNHSNLK